MTSLSEEVSQTLLQANSILDNEVRSAILADVWGRRPPPFGVSRHGNAVVDMGNIARACEENDVLTELVDVAGKYIPPKILQGLKDLLLMKYREPPQVELLRALLPKVEVSLDELATLCALSEPGYTWKPEHLANLASAVDVLAQMPGHIGEETPLIRLVVGLLGTQSPQVVAELSMWISAEWGISSEKLKAIRLRYAKEENAASQRNSVLVIELAPIEKFRYACQAWLWREIGDVLPWDQNPSTVQVGDTTGDEGDEEDNDDLQRVFSNVYDWACQQAGKRWTQMSVEFILPRELLCRKVEQLQVNYAAVKDAKLGLRFPVVVRPYERLQHYAALCDIWKDTWNKIVANVGALQLVQVHGGLSALQLEATTAWLNDLEYAHCLVFTFPPPSRAVPADQDALVRLFGSGGSAAAIWSRRQVEFSEPLAEEFKVRPSSQMELPRFGKELRVKSVMNNLAWAEDLVVLWDDPERLPPDCEPAAAFAET